MDATIELAADGFRQPQTLDLDRALQAVEREKSSLAQIIEMHYLGGMTAEEVAAVVDRSSGAVRHDIRLARVAPAGTRPIVLPIPVCTALRRVSYRFASNVVYGV